MEGRDSENAVVRTKHTKQNALKFCRDYVLKITAKCIEDTLAIPLSDEIKANCRTGIFSDIFGYQHQFKGKNSDENAPNKYIIVKYPSGELPDGTLADYQTTLGFFEMLCPASISEIN